MNTSEFIALSYEEKIAILTENPEEINLPDEASFVAQYLAQYRPNNPPVRHLDNESSIDISDTLQSVGLIDPKVVSRIMKMLGYKLFFQGVSQPVWSMKHIESI